MNDMEILPPDTAISHPKHGSGRVIYHNGDLVTVKFGGQVHQILQDELTPLPSVERALQSGQYDDSGEALIRASALAIRSVNDQWGCFRDRACNYYRINFGSAIRSTAAFLFAGWWLMMSAWAKP